MKQFISAHDVTDINALVAKALKYKDNPYIDKQLGFQKRIGLLFLYGFIISFLLRQKELVVDKLNAVNQ